MNSTTRFSTESVVESKALNHVIRHLEECWISHFWYTENIRRDKAFSEAIVKYYVNSRGINIQPVPPGRHSRYAIESNHAAIRSIYIRIKKKTPIYQILFLQSRPFLYPPISMETQ